MTDPRFFNGKPNPSWYDYSWDWAMAAAFALVLLAGIALWTYSESPQTSAISDDVTTGQSTRPSLPAAPH